MKASSATFTQMRNASRKMQTLAESCSFMQVEYGIKELEACWDGFVDTSDDADIDFKSKKQIFDEFNEALSGYIEFIAEPTPQ